MKISSNFVDDSNDDNNFPHNLLLNTPVSKLCKAVANGSSANIKLSNTQLHKIRQSGGILGRLLRPLLKTGLPLIVNVLRPFTKSVLKPLGLTVAASATEVALHKKMFASGNTRFIISNEEMNIMKIVKSLEESSLLIRR